MGVLECGARCEPLRRWKDQISKSSKVTSVPGISSAYMDSPLCS
jgi:hypothetical protein